MTALFMVTGGLAGALALAALIMCRGRPGECAVCGWPAGDGIRGAPCFDAGRGCPRLRPCRQTGARHG